LMWRADDIAVGRGEKSVGEAILQAKSRHSNVRKKTVASKLLLQLARLQCHWRRRRTLLAQAGCRRVAPGLGRVQTSGSLTHGA
jgi:hypothetical protein